MRQIIARLDQFVRRAGVAASRKDCARWRLKQAAKNNGAYFVVPRRRRLGRVASNNAAPSSCASLKIKRVSAGDARAHHLPSCDSREGVTCFLSTSTRSF